MSMRKASDGRRARALKAAAKAAAGADSLEYEGEPVECVKYDMEQPPMFSDDANIETPIEDRDHCGYVEAESDGEFLARLGTDAAKWSEAFCDMLMTGKMNLLNDAEGTMAGWFANAIGAGRVAGENRLIDAAFAEVDGTETELDMYKRFYAESARSYMEAQQRVTELETEMGTIVHRAVIGENQRDFLSRQVDSLVQRLAASHVAQGLIDMAAAQGFVQKEILPINNALAQIAAQQEQPT